MLSGLLAMFPSSWYFLLELQSSLANLPPHSREVPTKLRPNLFPALTFLFVQMLCLYESGLVYIFCKSPPVLSGQGWMEIHKRREKDLINRVTGLGEGVGAARALILFIQGFPNQ